MIISKTLEFRAKIQQVDSATAPHRDQNKNYKYFVLEQHGSNRGQPVNERHASCQDEEVLENVESVGSCRFRLGCTLSDRQPPETSLQLCASFL